MAEYRDMMNRIKAMSFDEIVKTYSHLATLDISTDEMFNGEMTLSEWRDALHREMDKRQAEQYKKDNTIQEHIDNISSTGYSITRAALGAESEAIKTKQIGMKTLAMRMHATFNLAGVKEAKFKLKMASGWQGEVWFKYVQVDPNHWMFGPVGQTRNYQMYFEEKQGSE